MHNEDVPLRSNAIPILVPSAMFLNAQISGISAATQKLTYNFVVHTILSLKIPSQVDIVKLILDDQMLST